MRKTLVLVAASLVAILSGCASAGLSGGSIPTGGGGGSLFGALLLPNGQAPVSAHGAPTSLVTGSAVTGIVLVSSNGTFTATGLPTNADLVLTFHDGAGDTLKTAVPVQELTGSVGKPINVGTVTALTTVVAASLELENAHGSGDVSELVSTQFSELNANVNGEGEDEQEQEDDVTNSTYLASAAQTLISITVNAEIGTLAGEATNQTAVAVLDGLIGQATSSGGSAVTLSTTQRSTLVAQQLANVSLTPTQIAAYITKTGGTATPQAVEAADAAQRRAVPNWSNLGSSITPFEALAIAIGSPGAGFHLTQAQINAYLASV